MSQSVSRAAEVQALSPAVRRRMLMRYADILSDRSTAGGNQRQAKDRAVFSSLQQRLDEILVEFSLSVDTPEVFARVRNECSSDTAGQIDPQRRAAGTNALLITKFQEFWGTGTSSPGGVKVDSNLDKAWFFPSLARTGAEAKLIATEKNVFLIRGSSQANAYALSKYNAQTRELHHFIIQSGPDGRSFKLQDCESMDPTSYPSLRELVSRTPELENFSAVDAREAEASSSALVEKPLSPEAAAKMKIMASYVPSLVLRRMIRRARGDKPSAPELENFTACVMFADISGFTPLTEKLGRLGLEGVEKLTSAINDYFRTMIDTIRAHGGDILKFAGDAVLVVWPTDAPEVLPGAIVLACQCALELISKLKDYKVVIDSKDGGPPQEQSLLLHIGLGAGPAHGVQLGGTNNRFEYFLAGHVLDQVSSCEKEAEAGEVFVSQLAWLSSEEGRLVGKQADEADAFANFKLTGVALPVPKPAPIGDMLSSALTPRMEDELKNFCQVATMRHIDSGSNRWNAELRQVSVIFVNLARPFALRDVSDFQAVISELQLIVQKYEGIVRQFMIDDKGSVFIAGFGCPPLSHTDDERRAVFAALDMVLALSELKMSGSIGVTTGQAYVGDVGSLDRREFAMVGDIVNLSARLMVSAKSGILVDQKTRDAAAVDPKLTFETLAPIMVKGKTQPIPIFKPKYAKEHHHHHHHHGETERAAMRGVATSRSVGRDQERNLLAKTVLEMESRILGGTEAGDSSRLIADAHDSGQGDRVGSLPLVLVIEGSQGIGKTKLLLELQMILDQNSHPMVRSTGSQLNSATPYHAWTDIFGTLCLQNMTDPATPKLRPDVARAVGEDVLPLLNSVLPALQLPETRTTSELSSQRRADKTLQVLLAALQASCKDGTAIVLDDAQHLDSSSWSLAEKVSTQMRKIMLVLALRPGKKEVMNLVQLKRHPCCSVISLKEFRPADTAKLSSQLLNLGSSSSMPESIAEAIHAKGQGNPFYVEQICQMLRESGSCKIDQQKRLVETPALLTALKDVPSSVVGLITTKVDRLEPAQQVVLRLAAVMGRSFTVDILERLLPLESDVKMDRTALLEKLRALEKHDFVETSDPQRLSYTFASTLVSDVVYNAMLFSHRRDVHKKLAEIYQLNFTGQVQYYAIIAYHKEHGEMLKEAQDLYIKAGSYHLTAYSNAEATSLLRSAADLLVRRKKAGSMSHIAVLRKLGQAAINGGLMEEARSYLDESLAYLGIDTPGQGSASVEGSFAQQNLGKKPVMLKNNHAKTQGWKFTHEAKLEKEDQLAYRKREATISLLGLAHVNFFAGNVGACIFCASGALQLARDQGSGEHCEALAAMLLVSDDSTAPPMITEALKLAGQRLDLLKIVQRSAGMYYAGRGDWSKAIKAFKDVIQHGNDVGDSKSVESARSWLATVYGLQGHFDHAHDELGLAISSAIDRGDLQTQVMASNTKAWVHLMEGNDKESAEVLEHVRTPLDTIGATDAAAELNCTGMAALLAARRGQGIASLGLITRLTEQLSSVDPTMFFMFPGYACLAEAYYVASQKDKIMAAWKVQNISTKNISVKIREAATILRGFADRFPFAKPRADMWMGVYHALDGKSRAAKDFKTAEEGAAALKMQYDLALSQYERGSVLDDAALIDQAVSLFPCLAKRDSKRRRKKSRSHSRSSSDLNDKKLKK